MTLKTCSTCKRNLKTTDAQRLAKCDGLGVKMLYVNCKFCGSTLTLVLKRDQRAMRSA